MGIAITWLICIAIVVLWNRKHLRDMWTYNQETIFLLIVFAPAFLCLMIFAIITMFIVRVAHGLRKS